MTFKIEKSSGGRRTIVRLLGEIRSEHIDLIRSEMQGHRSRFVLDLSEVSLVDLYTVRFLSICEAEGVELVHCSRYIREWISREQRT